MNPKIHPSAIIDSSAVVHESAEIGPFSIIGPNVVINAGVKVFPHTYFENCEIGEGTFVSSGAVIGTAPQDLGYKGEPTKVIIGKNCQIREHVTVNRSSGEGTVTSVGDNCMLMTGSHVAHNCKVGNNVILANNVLLAGHVLLEDYVFLGGGVAIQQHSRIGEMAFMGGMSGSRQDVPPYCKASGAPAGIIGTNFIGLRRRGLTPEERNNLKLAFKFLWYSNLNQTQAIDRIRCELEMNKHIEHLISFVESSKKGVIGRMIKNQVMDEVL